MSYHCKIIIIITVLGVITHDLNNNICISILIDIVIFIDAYINLLYHTMYMHRHNLPLISIMNKDASINDNGGAYTGLDRFACREKIWSDMEEKGLVIKVDPHLQRVPRSQR